MKCAIHCKVCIYFVQWGAHYSHVPWTSRQLKSLVTSWSIQHFLEADNKENNTLLGLCEGNPPMTDRADSNTKGQQSRKCFHVIMSPQFIFIFLSSLEFGEAVPNTRIHQNLALHTGHQVIYAHLSFEFRFYHYVTRPLMWSIFIVQFWFASPVLRKSSDSLGASKVTLVDNGELDRNKSTAKYKLCA